MKVDDVVAGYGDTVADRVVFRLQMCFIFLGVKNQHVNKADKEGCQQNYRKTDRQTSAQKKH